MLRLPPVACLLSLACVLLLSLTGVHALQDIYCGRNNCYSLLNVSHDATKQEIKKQYFKLSLQYHPDKNSSPDALDIFRGISTAYEVLSDDALREKYDSSLLHPDDYLTNQYYYYQYRYQTGHISVWKILLVTLVVCTALHYMYWRHQYFKLRYYMGLQPIVQQRMRQVAKNALMEEKGKKMKNYTPSKAEIDAYMASDDVGNYVEITGWASRLPTIYDTLPIWLLRAPIRMAQWAYWHARFIVLFQIMQREYGDEERSYMTACALGLDYNKWQAVVTDEQKNELISKQLWIKKNFETYRRECMQARNASKKSYR